MERGRMIVLDIETSGGPAIPKYGIWQIGAIDLETGGEFLEEGRIDKDEEIIEEALEITGRTREELRDKNKQSQKELIEKFLEWLELRKNKDIICMHPQFDLAFLWLKINKYNLNSKCFGFPNHHRAIDLHTLAETVYYKKNNEFLTKEGHSDMGLSKILAMFGVKDKRRKNIDGKISEGSPHNALEDCKLEKECFEKLLKELEK